MTEKRKPNGNRLELTKKEIREFSKFFFECSPVFVEIYGSFLYAKVIRNGYFYDKKIDQYKAIKYLLEKFDI